MSRITGQQARDLLDNTTPDWAVQAGTITWETRT